MTGRSIVTIERRTIEEERRLPKVTGPFGNLLYDTARFPLLDEAAPLALIAAQAGGLATAGELDVLDIEPTTLHEWTPLYLGSRECVRIAERFIRGTTTS